MEELLALDSGEFAWPSKDNANFFFSLYVSNIF